MFKVNQLKLILVLFLFSNFVISAPNKQLPQDSGPWVVNAYYESLDQLREYARVDEPLHVNREKKYFEVYVANIEQYQKLLSYGFNLEINQKQTQSSKTIKQSIQKNNLDKSVLGGGIPGFSCYRTVEETFATMDTLVANHPTLASIEDIGDTWSKEDSNGKAGYDMRVLKITNTAIDGPKPKLFAISSIHARELAPAELNTRFAEYLLNNYGTDADATWLVDHREIHLLLQGNPDGRKQAENGEFWRKNYNQDFCNTPSQRGVDMNRNFLFKWNAGSGSSSNVCDEIYHGPSPLSESENTAVDEHLKLLFTDQRGTGLNDPAPADTSGVYIDIHSYGELVMWPYGYDDPGAIPLAPNHQQLQTLGRKFSWFNNYYPQASNELYGADGASDDNAYGQLGVASYTFELGTTFFQSCGTFDNTIFPDNLKALVYAAKVAEAPYIMASGPDIENINLSDNGVIAGSLLTVTGLATDTRFSNVNGNESTQSISTVEMFIDELPWDESSTPFQLDASDGNFNSNSENFTGTIDTTGLSAGQHIVYLQSTDLNAITGVPSAIFVNIVDPNLIGTLTGKVRDLSSNLPLEAVSVILDANQVSTNNQGDFEFSVIEGDYTLTASKQGYASTSIENLSITALQETVQDIHLQQLCSLLDENVNAFSSIADAVSAGWSHGRNTGSDDWNVDMNQGINNSHSFNTADVGSLTDKFLISPPILLTSQSSLEFWHKYVFEEGQSFYDGAVLEISTNSGSSWQDLGNYILTGQYNATLSSGNALGARTGWGGSNPAYSKVEVDLSAFAGQNAQIRWRFGADSNVGAGDWNIDDIKILDPSVCEDLGLIFYSGFESSEL